MMEAFPWLMLLCLVPSLQAVSAVDKQISFSLLTSDKIDGIYYRSSDFGIHFISTTDSLSVSALNGDTIMQVSKTFGDYRIITIGQELFVQTHDSYTGVKTDYAVPFHIKELKKDQYYLSSLLYVLKDLPPGFHHQALQDSIAKLLLTRIAEVKLFREAAVTMGVDLSITGSENPAALLLYMTAMQLDGLMSNYSTSSLVSSSFLTANDEDCLAECPPCEEELCLGMCGYSCNCWKWVCGDCCYHLGCYGHDVCCREKFIQTKCLFPFGFKCESEYTC